MRRERDREEFLEAMDRRMGKIRRVEKSTDVSGTVWKLALLFITLIMAGFLVFFIRTLPKLGF